MGQLFSSSYQMGVVIILYGRGLGQHAVYLLHEAKQGKKAMDSVEFLISWPSQIRPNIWQSV